MGVYASSRVRSLGGGAGRSTRRRDCARRQRALASGPSAGARRWCLGSSRRVRVFRLAHRCQVGIGSLSDGTTEMEPRCWRCSCDQARRSCQGRTASHRPGGQTAPCTLRPRARSGRCRRWSAPHRHRADVGGRPHHVRPMDNLADDTSTPMMSSHLIARSSKARWTRATVAWLACSNSD